MRSSKQSIQASRTLLDRALGAISALAVYVLQYSVLTTCLASYRLLVTGGRTHTLIPWLDELKSTLYKRSDKWHISFSNAPQFDTVVGASKLPYVPVTLCVLPSNCRPIAAFAKSRCFSMRLGNRRQL